MRALHFFLTHHLNQIIPNERRATALSFRGLSMNLAYGALMQLFAWQTAWLMGRLGPQADETRVFVAAAEWWPWCFAAGYAALLAWIALRHGTTLNGLVLRARPPVDRAPQHG